jgi:PIN domain nuclease of toxin-antitoxin system
MKRLLLDTHTLLWWLADTPALGPASRAFIAEPGNVVFVSAASIWEISIKRALGKLSAPESLDSILEEEGFEALPIEVFHAEQAGTLPLHHRDPFDRMLVAQAQAEGLTLVTADPQMTAYGVRVLDPGR